jgi:N-succinyldiaminopimelate aminotransferase
VRGVKQFLSFSGGTPLQHAAAAGLGLEDETAALTASLRARRDRLAAGLTEAGFDVLASPGTYFLCADARPLGEPDAAALSLRLPLEAGVVAIPVSAFTASPAPETDGLLRFTFCKRDDVLDEGIARLLTWRA